MSRGSMLLLHLYFYKKAIATSTLYIKQNYNNVNFRKEYCSEKWPIKNNEMLCPLLCVLCVLYSSLHIMQKKN